MTTMEWLHHDAELLTLLSSWDDDDAHSDGKTSSSEGSRRPAQVNVTRERVKREKTQLLASIDQLAAEAKRLRERRELVMRRQSGGDMVVLWEGMARRHLRARKRAEALNERLRGMVETLHAVARELLRAARRAEQVRQATLSSAVFGSQNLGDDVYLLPQLTARLQQLSDQWQLPFRRSSKLQRNVGEFLDIKALRDDQLEVVVETTARSSYPFPAGDVEEAIFHYLQAARIHDEEFSIIMEGKSTDVTQGVRVRSTVSTVGLHGTGRARCVRKRFRNDQGEFLLVTSIGGTLNLSAPNLHDSYTRLSEDSWMRISQQLTMPPLTTFETIRRSRVLYNLIFRIWKDTRLHHCLCIASTWSPLSRRGSSMAAPSWLDDAELLALLADWDESGGEALLAKPLPTRVNGTRERVKEEKRRLLACVQQLTTDIKRLRVRRERLLRRHCSSDTVAAWENMARRQLFARKRAEALNDRLRGMVESQRAVATELLRAIRRAEQMREATQSSAVFCGSSFPLIGDDVSLLRQLTATLQRASEQWRVPFTQNSDLERRRRSGQLRGDFAGVNLVRDDRLEAFIETAASVSYPFPLQIAESVIWQLLANLRYRDEEFSFVLEGEATDSPSGVRERSAVSRVGLYCAEHALSLRRRFRTSEGEFLLVSSLGGTLSLNATDLHDTYARLYEESWIRIKQESALPPRVVFEMVRHSRLVYRYQGEKQPSRPEVDKMKELLTAIRENEMRSLQDAVERLFIQSPTLDESTASS